MKNLLFVLMLILFFTSCSEDCINVEAKYTSDLPGTSVKVVVESDTINLYYNKFLTDYKKAKVCCKNKDIKVKIIYNKFFIDTAIVIKNKKILYVSVLNLSTDAIISNKREVIEEAGRKVEFVIKSF